MIEQHARHFFQKTIINPVAAITPSWISPIQITLLAALLGILVPILTYLHYIYLAVITLILSGYLDILDGSLARLRNQSSPLGAILDITGDRVVELSAVIALYVIAPHSRAPLCLALLGSFYLCITSFLVVGVFAKNQTEKSFHYSPGLIERAETFIVIIAILLFPDGFTWLASMLIALVLLTTVLHLRSAARHHCNRKVTSQ